MTRARLAVQPTFPRECDYVLLTWFSAPHVREMLKAIEIAVQTVGPWSLALPKVNEMLPAHSSLSPKALCFGCCYHRSILLLSTEYNLGYPW